ncbi:MAG: hypothetical protein OSA84_05380 [Akkermansiaceae bacterium]|nr:hypothetical protein [Akkermansiaceae bacterium]
MPAFRVFEISQFPGNETDFRQRQLDRFERAGAFISKRQERTLLPSHNPAPGVKFFEFKNHPNVSGETHYRRLNVYRDRLPKVRV